MSGLGGFREWVAVLRWSVVLLALVASFSFFLVATRRRWAGPNAPLVVGPGATLVAAFGGFILAVVGTLGACNFALGTRAIQAFEVLLEGACIYAGGFLGYRGALRLGATIAAVLGEAPDGAPAPPIALNRAGAAGPHGALQQAAPTGVGLRKLGATPTPTPAPPGGVCFVCGEGKETPAHNHGCPNAKKGALA
jgi:hypothetical protein